MRHLGPISWIAALSTWGVFFSSLRVSSRSCKPYIYRPHPVDLLVFLQCRISHNHIFYLTIHVDQRWFWSGWYQRKWPGTSILGRISLWISTRLNTQIPVLPGNWALIDLDTPQNAHTKPSWNGGPDMELVFSDEFNTPGRTFWPGDDPYWEAVDLHYWVSAVPFHRRSHVSQPPCQETNNLEWYSPEAITTQDGNLVVTLSQQQTHNLNYQGGTSNHVVPA